MLGPVFNPRQDLWDDHFHLHQALIVPLTPTERITVRLLQLNRPERIKERLLIFEARLP